MSLYLQFEEIPNLSELGYKAINGDFYFENGYLQITYSKKYRENTYGRISINKCLHNGNMKWSVKFIIENIGKSYMMKDLSELKNIEKELLDV